MEILLVLQGRGRPHQRSALAEQGVPPKFAIAQTGRGPLPGGSRKWTCAEDHRIFDINRFQPPACAQQLSGISGLAVPIF